MTTASMITTAEQLFQKAGGLGRCELVRGALLMMSPAGSRHGAVTLRISTLLANHVDALGLGSCGLSIRRLVRSRRMPVMERLVCWWLPLPFLRVTS